MILLTFLLQTIRIAIPYLLAAAGGVMSERVGIIALGLEGMMLAGAFGAALGSYYGGNAWAGLAGALYVPIVGIINPGEFSPGNSIEAVVWVAFGGRGTLIGAILGAFSVNALKTWLTSFAPDLWLLVLGALFIIVTIFLPRGLIGLIKGRGS